MGKLRFKEPRLFIGSRTVLKFKPKEREKIMIATPSYEHPTQHL
jgi:hypothetical protein